MSDSITHVFKKRFLCPISQYQGALIRNWRSSCESSRGAFGGQGWCHGLYGIIPKYATGSHASFCPPRPSMQLLAMTINRLLQSTMLERRSPYIIKAYTLMNYTNGAWTEVNKRVTIGHWKVKVTCSRATHACWAILRRYWCSFDIMRSIFEIVIFAFSAHFSDSEFHQDSKCAFSFVLRCIELSKIASKKMKSYLFHYIVL